MGSCAIWFTDCCTMKVVAALLFVVAVAAEQAERLYDADLERVSEMEGKLNHFNKKLMGSALSSEDKDAAHKNINAIHKDLERIKSAVPNRRKDLIKAVHLRVAALQDVKKKMSERDLERKERDEVISKIETDLNAAEKAVKASEQNNKESILENIHSMKNDVKRLEHANTDEKHRLTKALGLRMQALKKQTAHTDVKEAASNKVNQDLERVLTEVKSSHMDSKKKEEIKSNVAAMKQDLEKISSAAPEYKGRLRQALKLRMKALKQQVHSSHEDQDLERERREEARSKLSADLNKVASDVAQGPLPESMRAEIQDNIHEMQHDLEKMSSASPEYAQLLKKAMQLRTQALHEQIAESTEPLHQNLERASNVMQDLEKIMSDVERSNMPSSKRIEIEENIKAMQKDLEKMHDASPDFKHRLQQALHLRFQALQEQIPHQELNMEREKKEKVISDLEKVKGDIRKSKLAANQKDQALKNVETMMHDMEKMQTAAPEYKQRLAKALKLRMSALKGQLLERNEESTTPATKVLADLDKVLSEVKKEHPAQMAAIESNIAAMRHDVEKLQSSHLKAADKKKLAKALSLRDQALEQQLKKTDVSKDDQSTTRVQNDLEKVLHDVERSHKLSESTKQAVKENIQHMKSDLAKMETAAAGQKDRLKKALGLRMQALKEQIAEDKASSEEKPSLTKKVSHDLEVVSADVQKAHLSSEERDEAIANIAAMKTDVEKLESAAGPQKARLQKALGLRMAALKEQLSGSDDAPVDNKKDKVMKDLEKVELEVSKKKGLSLSRKTEIKNNIHHMKTDLEKMESADAPHKDPLHKALSLRMKALKEQLA